MRFMSSAARDALPESTAMLYAIRVCSNVVGSPVGAVAGCPR
jgi:hypothetical protein